MSQFELPIRETVATTNLFQSVASKKSDKRAECNLGNHFAPAQTNVFDNNVVKLIDFIKKRANLYFVSSPYFLHRIATQQSFPNKYFAKRFEHIKK